MENHLIVLTAHNQAVFEFHILKGRLTDWSRRNSPSRFVQGLPERRRRRLRYRMGDRSIYKGASMVLGSQLDLKLGDASSHKRPDGDGDVTMIGDATPSYDDDDFNNDVDDDSTDTRWG
ncbi:hypothetical protein L211DRAFT_544681 [Terfezia boudieri ATCC MYA-4762]|uniref:Uncharacterized protein n=1 Tax=Terfezia boudieri ATCC MYA-4762 TaxID=1051890 RepID=A0A3N4LX03_9PEZI|nr:hypothetical protein L211DRAFT_544681 [Terfezia boudieri ATCC MYA-4762]